MNIAPPLQEYEGQADFLAATEHTWQDIMDLFHHTDSANMPELLEALTLRKDEIFEHIRSEDQEAMYDQIEKALYELHEYIDKEHGIMNALGLHIIITNVCIQNNIPENLHSFFGYYIQYLFKKDRARTIAVLRHVPKIDVDQYVFKLGGMENGPKKQDEWQRFQDIRARLIEELKIHIIL